MSHKFLNTGSINQNPFQENRMVYFWDLEPEIDNSEIAKKSNEYKETREKLETLYPGNSQKNDNRRILVDVINQELEANGRKQIEKLPEKFQPNQIDEIQLLIDIMHLIEAYQIDPKTREEAKKNKYLDVNPEEIEDGEHEYAEFKINKNYLNRFNKSDEVRLAIISGQMKGADQYRMFLYNLGINQEKLLDRLFAPGIGVQLESGANRNDLFKLSFLSRLKNEDNETMFTNILEAEKFITETLKESKYEDLSYQERKLLVKIAGGLRDIHALMKFMERMEPKTVEGNSDKVFEAERLTPEGVTEFTFSNKFRSNYGNEFERERSEFAAIDSDYVTNPDFYSYPETLVALIAEIYGGWDKIPTDIVEFKKNPKTDKFDAVIHNLPTLDTFPKGGLNITLEGPEVEKGFGDLEVEGPMTFHVDSLAGLIALSHGIISDSSLRYAGDGQSLAHAIHEFHGNKYYKSIASALRDQKITVAKEELDDSITVPEGTPKDKEDEVIERITNHELTQRIVGLIASPILSGPVTDEYEVMTHEDKFGRGDEATILEDVNKEYADTAIYQAILKEAEDNETQTYSLSKLAEYLNKTAALGLVGLIKYPELYAKYKDRIAEGNVNLNFTAEELKENPRVVLDDFTIDMVRIGMTVSAVRARQELEAWKTIADIKTAIATSGKPLTEINNAETGPEFIHGFEGGPEIAGYIGPPNEAELESQLAAGYRAVLKLDKNNYLTFHAYVKGDDLGELPEAGIVLEYRHINDNGTYYGSRGGINTKGTWHIGVFTGYQMQDRQFFIEAGVDIFMLFNIPIATITSASAGTALEYDVAQRKESFLEKIELDATKEDLEAWKLQWEKEPKNNQGIPENVNAMYNMIPENMRNMLNSLYAESRRKGAFANNAEATFRMEAISNYNNFVHGVDLVALKEAERNGDAGIAVHVGVIWLFDRIPIIKPLIGMTVETANHEATVYYTDEHGTDAEMRLAESAIHEAFEQERLSKDNSTETTQTPKTPIIINGTNGNIFYKIDANNAELKTEQTTNAEQNITEMFNKINTNIQTELTRQQAEASTIRATYYTQTFKQYGFKFDTINKDQVKEADKKYAEKDYLAMSFNADFFQGQEVNIIVDREATGIHLANMETKLEAGRMQMALKVAPNTPLVITRTETIKSDGTKVTNITLSNKRVALDSIRRAPIYYHFDAAQKQFTEETGPYVVVNKDEKHYRDVITGEIYKFEKTIGGDAKDLGTDTPPTIQKVEIPEEFKVSNQPKVLEELSEEFSGELTNERITELKQLGDKCFVRGRRGRLFEKFSEAITLSYNTGTRPDFKTYLPILRKLIEYSHIKIALTDADIQYLFILAYVKGFRPLPEIKTQSDRRRAIRQLRERTKLVKTHLSKYYKKETSEHLKTKFPNADGKNEIINNLQSSFNTREQAVETHLNTNKNNKIEYDPIPASYAHAQFLSLTGPAGNLGTERTARGFRLADAHGTDANQPLQYIKDTLTGHTGKEASFIAELIDPIGDPMSIAQLQNSHLALQIASGQIGMANEGENTAQISILPILLRHYDKDLSIEEAKNQANTIGNIMLNKITASDENTDKAIAAFTKVLVSIRQAQLDNKSLTITLQNNETLQMEFGLTAGSMLVEPCGNSTFALAQEIKWTYQVATPNIPQPNQPEALGTGAHDLLSHNTSEKFDTNTATVIAAGTIKGNDNGKPGKPDKPEEGKGPGPKPREPIPEQPKGPAPTAGNDILPPAQ